MGNLFSKRPNQFLERYLNDVFEKECMLKASKEEVEFIQTGIETLVQKIVDLVLQEPLPDLYRKVSNFKKEELVEVYFNYGELDSYPEVKTARCKIIKVGSFYEGTKNNYPDEFDFIFTFMHAKVTAELEPFCERPSFARSSIEAAATKNKHSLIFKPSKQSTDPRELYFDQYLQEHGPASLLRFIYINSSGDRMKIHVDLVPACKITPYKMKNNLPYEKINPEDPSIAIFKMFLNEEVMLNETLLTVSGEYSYTETEVRVMRNVLSEKHRKVYRIVKILINGHRDGELRKLLFWGVDTSSYTIKLMIIHHHYGCANSDTDLKGDCVIKILKQICEYHYYITKKFGFLYNAFIPYLKILIQSLVSLQATEDTYSYDHVRMKSASRQCIDGIKRNDQRFGSWFRYLDTLDGDDPSMDSFEQFLDAEIPDWRKKMGY